MAISGIVPYKMEKYRLNSEDVHKDGDIEYRPLRDGSGTINNMEMHIQLIKIVVVLN